MSLPITVTFFVMYIPAYVIMYGPDVMLNAQGCLAATIQKKAVRMTDKTSLDVWDGVQRACRHHYRSIYTSTTVAYSTLYMSQICIYTLLLAAIVLTE